MEDLMKGNAKKTKGVEMPQGQALKGPGQGSPFSFNPTPMWEQLLQEGDEAEAGTTPQY